MRFILSYDSTVAPEWKSVISIAIFIAKHSIFISVNYSPPKVMRAPLMDISGDGAEKYKMSLTYHIIYYPRNKIFKEWNRL